MKLLQKVLDIFFPPSQVEKDLLSMMNQSSIPAASPLPQKNMYAGFSYRNSSTRRSIRVLKTRHNIPIAKCFAKILHENIESIIHDKEPFLKFSTIILVPLPVTIKRLRKRGFNQTELISSEIAKLDTRYLIKNILIKNKDTEKQAVSTSRAQRKKNIQGCFSCKKNNLKNSGILYIVIDDVVTTGATMHEAMKTMRNGGYKPVLGMAVAH